MKYEKEFARSLFRNAVIFLDSAIKYFNEGLDYHVNMVQSIVNLQFALELALKSSVTSQYGIRTILINKQKELKDSELEELYLANKLKVREYDDIKNYIKGKGHLFGFNRKEYKYMEMFQKHRNCVLHSSYHFSVDEKKDIEKEIIYTLIHVLGILMSAEITEDRIFMQEYLNENEYTKLLENSFYIKELEDFLRKEYDEVYICPDCLTRTLTPDFKCARCFNVFSDFHFYGYAECGDCGESMVIFDAANIECNNNYMRGMCLNCGNETTIYKCPKCGKCIDVELEDKTNCHENFCSIFDEI